MNALIIDDNKIARTTMRHLADKVADLVVVAECADAMEAFELLRTRPVDLLLLDIEMPGMSGLELTGDLGSMRPLIIFISSRDRYARLRRIDRQRQATACRRCLPCGVEQEDEHPLTADPGSEKHPYIVFFALVFHQPVT